MSIRETEASLHAFISESFLSDEEPLALDRDTDLFQRFDSLQVLRIVLQIEQHFGVTVADSDLTADNLGSIAKAAAFVERKRQAAALETRPAAFASVYSASLETSREPAQPVKA